MIITSTACGGCGANLNESPAGLERSSCPRCGSAKIVVAMLGEAEQKASPHMAALAHNDATEFGFRESERFDGASAFGDLTGSTATSGAAGIGSHGEADTLETCRRLVRALNAQGATWSSPRAGDADVDAVSKGERDELLQVQVVRVPADQDYWRQLSKTASAERTTSITEAADSLFAAIDAKARIPPQQRPALTLVLDANRAPALTFQLVVAEFHARHRSQSASLGFAAIYVIGPDDALVKRLV